MLIRYNKKLETSGLQFSFKAGHSTVMSSLAMKEVINYYWNRHSKVYVALIDASKAFDRVRYDRLFDLLYKWSIPPLILRTIIDMYERQESRASWENMYGDYFGCINGVRQGGVISPLMFTNYMDELLNQQQASCIGCHIGILAWVLWITGICPGLRALKRGSWYVNSVVIDLVSVTMSRNQYVLHLTQK